LTPKEQYAETHQESLLKLRGVSIPKGKKGFGSSALWSGGKMFAFLSSKDKFVVKLPKDRVDALDGKGRSL
jgi:hypothetical protein